MQGENCSGDTLELHWKFDFGMIADLGFPGFPKKIRSENPQDPGNEQLVHLAVSQILENP